MWKPLNRYNLARPVREETNGLTKEKMAIERQILLPPIPPKKPVPRPAPVVPQAATVKELDDIMKTAIMDEECIPEDVPLKETIGKRKGLMWPRTYAMTHPAEKLLTGYATEGCPVDCGENWTEERIREMVMHGPHKSATSKEAIAALHEETQAKVTKGFAKMVRFGDIKDNLPKNLKISPVACIPHKSKKFRVILDLSFKLKTKHTIFPSVNDTTIKMAPPEAMVQLGACVKRLIATMAENYDKEKPFKFCKLDIKDGFWRLVVHEQDAWNFCYVLPSKDGKHIPIDETILVVPNSLQMGWCESPPFFCAASETARDIIDTLIRENTILPPHKFEDKMMPQEKDTSSTNTPDGQTTLMEVFVDDFVGATNRLDTPYLLKLTRAMLHGIHAIFPPNEVTNHPGGDSIAEQKIDKGEGKWHHKKEILGWDFDGEEYTMQLPPAKCDKINKLISKLLKAKQIPLKRFQELAGKLQHASLGIPGGTGLLSPLQMAMQGNPKFVTVTDYLRDTLKDWRLIIQHMKNNPTSVLQLVKDFPNFVGFSDACKLGAGGV